MLYPNIKEMCSEHRTTRTKVKGKCLSLTSKQKIKENYVIKK
jgi:hypothetical protein